MVKIPTADPRAPLLVGVDDDDAGHPIRHNSILVAIRAIQSPVVWDHSSRHDDALVVITEIQDLVAAFVVVALCDEVVVPRRNGRIEDLEVGPPVLYLGVDPQWY